MSTDTAADNPADFAVTIIDVPDAPYMRVNSNTLSCDYVTADGVVHQSRLPINTPIYLTDGETYQFLTMYKEPLDITIALPGDKMARLTIK